MSRHFCPPPAAVVTLLAACALRAHGAEVIYDTSPIAGQHVVLFCHDPGEMSSTDERSGGSENQAQWAQYIHLAGANRRVTQIDAWYEQYTVAAPITFDATLRIYAAVPNGTDVLPGALLWQDTSVGLTLAQGTAGLTPQRTTFDLNVVLPDSVFLAISHSNFDFHGGPTTSLFGNAGRIGLPVVGSADSWFFEQLTESRQWQRDPNGNTGLPGWYTTARITAEPVPAPTAMMTIGMSAIALGIRRR